MQYFEVIYLQDFQKKTSHIVASNKSEAISLAKEEIPHKILKITKKSIPFSIRLTQTARLFQENFFSEHFARDSYITTIRQLSVMTDAGIAIQESLINVTQSIDDKELKKIFENITERVGQGLSLSDAMQIYEKRLQPISLVMTSLGENTGDISSALSKLADILEQMQTNRKKFTKAMRYPLFVISTIVIAFCILMLFVVPKFFHIFEQLGANLPVPTQVLLFLHHSVSQYGVFILIVLSGLFLSTSQLYRKNSRFRLSFDTFRLKIFFLGKLELSNSMHRFFLVLSELIKSGITITKALTIASQTIENSYINEKILWCKNEIEKGFALTSSFEQTKLIDPIILRMIEAGERSGSLEGMLEKSTDYYRQKSNDFIDNVSSSIEPILVGFIASIVLLLALGIFMPMWDLAGAMRG